MFDVLINGGPIMILLALCSIGGIYIAVQKVLFLRANRIKNPYFVDKVKRSITQSGISETIELLQSDKRMMSDFLAETIQLADRSFDELQFKLNFIVEQKLNVLERNMSTLSSIIYVAPILGLLGTMLGLIDLFNVISGGDIGNAEELSGGIAQALITTVTGLLVAIPFVFVYQYVNHRINQFINVSEKYANDVLDFCREQTPS